MDDVISFRVDPFEKERIDKLKEGLNSTYHEMFMTPFINSLDENHEQIKKDLEDHHKIKSYRREMTKQKTLSYMGYHFLNAYSRILTIIGKRINIQTNEDINIYSMVYIEVERTLDNYHKLPEIMLKVLEPEKNKFEELLTKQGIHEFLKNNHFKIKSIPFKEKIIDGKRAKQ